MKTTPMLKMANLSAQIHGAIKQKSFGYGAALLIMLSLFTTLGYGNPKSVVSEDSAPITLTISGTTSFCYTSNLTATYTVTNLSSGTFNWSLPGNCTLLSGAGTNSINVQWTSPGMGSFLSVTNGSSSGNISVSLYLTPSGSIMGPSSVCAGQTNVSYSIAGGPAFTGFSWNGVSNVSFPSGSSTQTVTANFASNFISGTFGATLLNGPCVGSATPKNVSVGGALPATPGSISGSTSVAPSQTAVPYSVGAVSNATNYGWSLPSGASISSGFGTNNITVNFPSSFSGGTISVTGSNSACSGASSPVLTINPNYLVAAAGPVSGPSSLCSTSGAFQFSVAPIFNATSYSWSFDGNVYPNDSQTTLNTIWLNFSQANSSTVHISVAGSNSHGSGTSSPTFTVAVSRPAAAAGSIGGASIVCPGQNGVTYQVPAITNATSYSWSMPPGASIATGSGTNSITVNFSSSFTGGTLSVQGIGGLCGPGQASSLAVGLPPVPVAAGVINGTSILCAGASNVLYNVPSISNATGYAWSLPSGASIASGANTNSILVNFSGSSVSGNVSVYGTSCVGNGASSSFPVTVFNGIPNALGSITGQTGVCENSSPTYSVTSNSSATNYSWSGTGGPASPSGSSNSVSINFPDNYPTSGGITTINVYGVNVCGSGPTSTLDVTVYKKPGAASAIGGPPTLCPGQTNVVYNVPAISNVNGYNWNLPTGLLPVSGTNSNTLTVNVGAAFVSGSLTVLGVDGACGGGPSSSLPVSLIPVPSAAGAINGASSVCTGQTSVSYNLTTDIVSATGYVWSLPSGASIASGTNTKSITVNFSASAVSGNISVLGTNCSGNGTSANFSVTVSSPPGALGPITGQTGACENSSPTYSVNSNSSVTSYSWYGTGGPASPSGSSNSVPINFPNNYPTSGGITVINVYGVNACGSGPTSTINVTVFKKPGVASSITGLSTICPGQTNVLYTASSITNVNSYNWILPPGISFASQTTNINLIAVNVGSNFTGGQIVVQGVDGACGTGTGTSLALSLPTQLPSAPGTISTSTVCPNVVYSVSAVSGVNYIWTLPSNATIVSGANTNSITVSYAASGGGTVSVYGTNCTGAGPASAIAVTAMPLPDAAGSITGLSSVCPGQNSISYSVPAINNANGYVWTVPPNVTIVSGQNTNSILVNFSTQSTSGNITVYGTSCGGVGMPSQPYSVTAQPTPNNAGAIIGKTVACNQTGVVYSIQPIPNAPGYVWTVPPGATITSGQNTTSITVDFTGAVQAGAVSVNSLCGNGGTSASILVNTAGGPEVKHSVDLVTGTLSAALPLFEVSDGDVSVPISLQYAALGVRVTDDDGWSGSNWSVSTQSYGIFREMRNLPDDYLVTTQVDPQNPDNRVGWLINSTKTNIKNFVPSTDNDPNTCSDEVGNNSFLNTLSYNQDIEPDVFHVSVPGLSFDFYFDENNLAQVVPYTDVIITPNTTSGPITSFTIKDSKGVVYLFSDMESITQSIFQSSPYFFVRLSNMHNKQFTYTTAWRLTAISSPIYGTINFNYNTIQSNDNSLATLRGSNTGPWYQYLALRYVYRYPLLLSNSSGAAGTLSYYRTSVMKVPTGITSPSMEAEFVSLQKPGSVLQRLQAINLYEKRNGGRNLVKQYNLSYFLSGSRAFLSGVNVKIACVESNYRFDYNLNPAPPDYTSTDKDEWDLFKYQYYVLGMPQYDETAAAGSLRKITQPLNGYTVFFYETHDYWDGSTNVQGGGIRVKKIIQYDGVSSNNDVIQDFSYKATNGNSSGKLQHKNALSFSVAKQPIGSNIYRYSEWQQNQSASVSQTNAAFTVTGAQDLSPPNELNGSAVAYNRVMVTTKDAGYSVYEYDLPASYQETSANSNEWTASKVLIARPSTGNSACFEKPNIDEGYYRYPFPVNPPYNYARGLLNKVTDFNTSGTKVRDVVYTYQRVYKGTGVNKVYGLALEELPTYYYNGSAYVDNKMFLYSKYELYTNLKTELSQQTETIYNSADLTSKTQLITSYYFDSPNHRQLSRTVTQHSDGSVTINRIKYVQDFNNATAADPASVAIKGLNDSHRVAMPVETTTSKMIGGTEKYIGANITVFQTGNASKVYPYQTYHYVSNDGNGGFAPSSVSANTFTFDNTHYVLDKTFIAFDNFGNPSVTRDGSQDINATAYGYNGTVPIINVSHAAIGEIRYSDFETPTQADFFVTWPSPTYSLGMNSPQALNIPAGSSSSNFLTNGISCNRSLWYIFSGWVKSSVAGTLSIQVAGSTYTYNFTTAWSYCRMRIPITAGATNFTVSIWSSANAQLDDLALYPEQADFKAYTYQLPFGKATEKDARGNYRYYDYDLAGRPNASYDRDKNVIKKYEYQ